MSATLACLSKPETGEISEGVGKKLIEGPPEVSTASPQRIFAVTVDCQPNLTVNCQPIEEFLIGER